MPLKKPKSVKWKAVTIATIVIILALAFFSFSIMSFFFYALNLESVLWGNVGVIPIKGTIESDSYDSLFGSSLGADAIVAMIEEADDDPMVEVIFLDINSGGGSVVAGKQIMYAVRDAEKPVVAYMGDIGASAAYYIASAADEIVADEDTLTGSIGVVMFLPNYVGLMEKIGYNVTELHAGEFKTIGSPYRDMTGAERAMLEELLQDSVTDFKSDVLENRPFMDAVVFERVADGRILSGRQALDVGLIDFTGSRKFALERAKVWGELEGDVEEKHFYTPSPPFGMASSMGKAFGEGVVEGMQQSPVLQS